MPDRQTHVHQSVSAVSRSGIMGGLLVWRFDLPMSSGFGSCKGMWRRRLGGLCLIAWCFPGSGCCERELPGSPHVASQHREIASCARIVAILLAPPSGARWKRRHIRWCLQWQRYTVPKGYSHLFSFLIIHKITF